MYGRWEKRRREAESQGGGKWEKRGKITQHCAVFSNRQRMGPRLKATRSGKFKPHEVQLAIQLSDSRMMEMSRSVKLGEVSNHRNVELVRRTE